MAGKPVTRQMLRELEARAKALGKDKTVLDYVYDFLAEGNTQADLARDLSKSMGINISRGTLSTYLNGSPEGKAMLAQAKRACAEALVEQSLEILDDADEDREAIAKAKAQADARQWMASRMDRAAWGDASPQVNVSVSMPQLHLEALRQFNATRPRTFPSSPLLPPAGEDVEIVPED